jgi:hypothetical protein
MTGWFRKKQTEQVQRLLYYVQLAAAAAIVPASSIERESTASRSVVSDFLMKRKTTIVGCRFPTR